MDRACCGQWRRRPYSGYFASSGAIVSTDDAFQSRAGARARQARLVHGWQVTPAARRLWLALALAGRAAWRGTSWHRRSRMEPKPGDVVGARQGAAARASPPSDPSAMAGYGGNAEPSAPEATPAGDGGRRLDAGQPSMRDSRAVSATHHRSARIQNSRLVRFRGRPAVHSH